ncbi:MAG: PAS domain-containing protein [Gammaproteobacteria bacterium]|nr:PAS domain-containing protein [Gammaproteobacteria bacterium]
MNPCSYLENLIFKHLIDSFSGHIYWKDCQGVYLGCNQQQAIDLGFKSPDDIIGKNDFEISKKVGLSAEETQKIWQNDQEIIKNVRTIVKEESDICNGKLIHFLSYKSPLKNEKHEIIGIFGISLDITPYKDFEEKSKTLQNTDQQYFQNLFHKITGEEHPECKDIKEIAQDTVDYLMNILNIIPANLYWKDKEGHYLGCNNKILELYGFTTPEQILGKIYEDLMDKETAIRLRKLDQNIMKSGQVKILEEIGYDSYGNEAFYLSHKAPLRDKKGEVIGLLGISFDITERKKQEEELKQTKLRLEELEQHRQKYFEKLGSKVLGFKLSSDKSIEKYTEEMLLYLKNIIKVLPGNIYWKDRKGHFMGCNKNVLEMHGFVDESQIIGKSYSELLEKKYLASIKNIDQEIMESDQPQILEEAGFDKDGNEAVYLSHKVPLHNSEGRVIGLLGVSLDITQRKKAEQALKIAKEEAEAANKAKTQFIANMEHDLRTPSAGIYGLLDQMAKSEKDPERKNIFTLLSQAAEKLLNIYDSILQFTRIETGDLPILEKKFSPRELVNDIIALEKPAAIEKKLEFSLTIDDDIPDIIMGDPIRLNRILVNLLSNAIKFTQKGFVKVKVQLAEKIKPRGVLLKFIVEDSGIGIPQDQQSRIYEKFVRLDPSNRGIYRGTGLGLTIVKQFVNDLGGEIDLVSRVSKGSTFSIVLPFKLSIQTHPKKDDFQE